MRPSPLRTPLAVLRETIGLSQKEMAEIAECTTSAIQAIELGNRGLQKDMALIISFKTGINNQWLLGNDFRHLTEWGGQKPYTRASFERTQASLKRCQNSNLNDIRLEFIMIIEHFAALLLGSLKNQEVWFCIFKIELALDELTGRVDRMGPNFDGCNAVKSGFNENKEMREFAAEYYSQSLQEKPQIQGMIDFFSQKLIEIASMTSPKKRPTRIPKPSKSGATIK
jgi:plasmid maintenance system antidote protein VapI